MANKYSKLKIDTSKIDDWIKIWCEDQLVGNSSVNKTDTKDRIKYEIENDGKIIKLDIIKAGEGLSTICYKLGKPEMQTFSHSLADSIYERVSDVTTLSPFAKGFSVIIPEDEFNVVIGLIKENEGITLEAFEEANTPGCAKYKLFRFRGDAGDKVVIKYYPNTSRMQIQGKPLFVFNEVIAYVTEFREDKEALVDAHIQYCNLGISKEEVYEEIKCVLGEDLFNFLPRTHRAILSVAFNLCKIEMDVDDYSYLLINVGRAFEGFIKKVFAHKGLQCEGEQQLGKSFFEWDSNVPELKAEYSQVLGEEIAKEFTKMFRFYSNYRNPYMHSSGYDVTTTIIEDRQIAIEKFNEMISSMKSWYQWAKDKVL